MVCSKSQIFYAWTGPRGLHCLSGIRLVHFDHAQRKRSKGARLKIAHNPAAASRSARDVMHYGAEGYEATASLPSVVSWCPVVNVKERCMGIECYCMVGYRLHDLDCF